MYFKCKEEPPSYNFYDEQGYCCYRAYSYNSILLNGWDIKDSHQQIISSIRHYDCLARWYYKVNHDRIVNLVSGDKIYANISRSVLPWPPKFEIQGFDSFAEFRVLCVGLRTTIMEGEILTCEMVHNANITFSNSETDISYFGKKAEEWVVTMYMLTNYTENWGVGSF